MGDSENPIETLASKLQTLPAEIRWLHTQEDVIGAIATGTELNRGPWTKRADFLVVLTEKLHLSRIFAAGINLVLLIHIALKQYKFKVRKSDYGSLLFVGKGALRDEYLAGQFERENGKKVILLNEEDLNSFFKVQRVSFPKLIGCWIRTWKEIWRAVSPSYSLSGLKSYYCLTHVIRCGHKHVYLRAWFNCYFDKTHASPIGFSVASHPAIRSGAKTHYMPHGLLAHTLVLPNFSKIYCDNRFDAEWCKARLPCASIKIVPQKIMDISTRRVVAIAGTYCEPERHDLCRSFIEWARQNSVPVYIRKHPRDTSSYWEGWRNVSGVEIVEKECQFVDFLQEIQPRFLATWVSSTLLDALVQGVVPVMIDRIGYDNINTVFPMRDVSLCWPDQRPLAQNLLDETELRSVFVAQKILEATSQTSVIK